MEKRDKRHAKSHLTDTPGRVVRRPTTAEEHAEDMKPKRRRCCYRCVFYVSNLLLWLQTLPSGFPVAGMCANHADTPGQTAGNRKPTPEEMATCIPFLHEQIDLIRPKVLVALGATAVEGLLGKTVGITKLRGNWKIYRNIPLMPTYHPAYLLRNQAMSEKRRVWEDMLQVMEKLQMPISEKQRKFFTKA